jgi:hypothetical protein
MEKDVCVNASPGVSAAKATAAAAPLPSLSYKRKPLVASYRIR